MKPYLTLFLVWFGSGIGAFAGSVAGGALGKTGLFAGGAIGGLLASAAAASVAARLGWIPRESRAAAVVGAVVGFGIACGLTVLNLRTPVVALLSPALAGAGALLGSGFARRS
jgi:hypothetical protein